MRALPLSLYYTYCNIIYGEVASLKHVQSVDDLLFIWNACSPKVSVLLVMVIVPYALLFHVPMRPLSNVHPFTENTNSIDIFIFEFWDRFHKLQLLIIQNGISSGNFRIKEETNKTKTGMYILYTVIHTF